MEVGVEGRLRKDKLSEDEVRERLAAVDAYEASGLSGEAFAQTRGISYLDLRGCDRAAGGRPGRSRSPI